MLSFLPIVLSLIQEIAPIISSASAVAKIIDTLSAAIPAIIQEAKDLVPTVKNIIDTLRGNPAVTADQLDALDAIEAKIDADFDAADAAAKAEDDAAGG